MYGDVRRCTARYGEVRRCKARYGRGTRNIRMRYKGESYEVRFISVPELYEVRAYSVPEVRSDPLCNEDTTETPSHSTFHFPFFDFFSRRGEHLPGFPFWCFVAGPVDLR